MSHRKSNRDRAKKKHHPLLENEVMASRLQALLTPAIFNQEAPYRQLEHLKNTVLGDCSSTHQS